MSNKHCHWVQGMDSDIESKLKEHNLCHGVKFQMSTIGQKKGWYILVPNHFKKHVFHLNGSRISQTLNIKFKWMKNWICIISKPKMYGWKTWGAYNQGSKYRISGSYRMGVFHIGYRISGEISGIRADIGRSYQTLYIMKY